MKRVISFVLSVCMMSILLFSSCSKEDDKLNQYEWFSSNTFDVDVNVDGIISGIYPYAYCYLNDKIYLSTTITGLFAEEEFQDSKGFIIETDINDGKTTNIVNYKELMEDFLPSSVLTDEAAVYGMFPEDDKINIYISAQNTASGFSAVKDELFCLEYNPKKAVFDSYVNYSDVSIDTVMGSYIYEIAPLNDMTLAVINDNPFEEPTFIMYFLKDDALCKKIDLAEVTHTQIINYYGCILNNNELLAEVEINKDNKDIKQVVSINLDNFSTSVSDDISAFNKMGQIRLINGTDGVFSVATGSDGIYRAENGTMQKLIDYNFTDLNIYTARNNNVVAATHNKIILCGAEYDSLTLLNGRPHIRVSVLNGENINPYEGKIKLTVADMNGDIDYATAEAIRKFNSTDDKYYIELRVYDSDDDISGLYALTEVTNNVLIDIKNGDSPDIILNGASYQELNNSDYLLDLTSYIENSDINDTDFFTNIIKANYVGNAVYQIPLTGNIFGVRVGFDAIEAYSFTPSQYNEFVSSKANGYDPISVYADSDRHAYLNAVIGPHINEYINYQTKEVNFNTPEFLDACEFVSKAIMTTDINVDSVYLSEANRYIANSDTYFGYLAPYEFFRTAYTLNTPIKIAGTPYIGEKAGPQFLIHSSVAVSAECENIDAAWEFVRLLMSDEIMESTSFDYIPINRNAFNTLMNDMYITNTDYVSLILKLNDYLKEEEVYHYYGMADFSSEDIDSFRNNIEAIDTIASTNATVMMLIDEETDAYFEGQKSLEEVIEIINNRVTFCINEY